MISLNRVSSYLPNLVPPTVGGIALGIAALSALAIGILFAVRHYRKPLPEFKLTKEESETFQVLFSKTPQQMDQIPLIPPNKCIHSNLMRGVAKNGQPFFQILVYTYPQIDRDTILAKFPHASPAALSLSSICQKIILQRNTDRTWSQVIHKNDFVATFFTTPFTDDTGKWLHKETAIAQSFTHLLALIRNGRNTDIHGISWEYRSPLPKGTAIPSSALAPPVS